MDPGRLFRLYGHVQKMIQESSVIPKGQKEWRKEQASTECIDGICKHATGSETLGYFRILCKKYKQHFELQMLVK